MPKPRKIEIDVADWSNETWTANQFRALIRETLDQIPASVPDVDTLVFLECQYDDGPAVLHIAYHREQTPAECVAEDQANHAKAIEQEQGQRAHYEELKKIYEGKP